MSNTCQGTLKVYGDPSCTERVREPATRVFGLPLPDDVNPFLKTEPGNPPRLVFRTESTEVPPVSLVAELSAREPELVFDLHYSNWASGVRGKVVYINGKMTDHVRERWVIEEELSSKYQAPLPPEPATPIEEQAAAAESVTPPMPAAANEPATATLPNRSPVQSAAKALLLDCYGQMFQEIRSHGRANPSEAERRAAMLSSFQVLTQGMDEESRFYFQQLEEQCHLRVDRLQRRVSAHEKLNDCLRSMGDPSLEPLFNAADRQVLSGMKAMLRKFRPAAEPEFLAAS